MIRAYRFASYAFALDAPLEEPAGLAPFATSPADGAVAVRVRLGAPSADPPDDEAPGDEVIEDHAGGRPRLRGPSFLALLRPDGVDATLESGAAPALFALLGALVVRAAARDGRFVLHAAGRRTDEGAVLVLGPPGAGKSTWARAAGASAFCCNAALVDPASNLASPLPFTGRDDPSLMRVAPMPVARVLCIAPRPGSVERDLRPAQRSDLISAVVVHRGDGASAAAVAAAMLWFRGFRAGRSAPTPL